MRRYHTSDAGKFVLPRYQVIETDDSGRERLLCAFVKGHMADAYGSRLRKHETEMLQRKVKQ